MRRLSILFLSLLLLLAGCRPVEEPDPAPMPTPDPVPANTYTPEDFVVVDNFLNYQGDGPSLVGVDVSSHQREVDWKKVADAGVQFAMLRVGFRGYTQGGIFMDEYFVRNVEGARRAGLDVGVYFFSQAVSEAEAKEEALKVLDWIAPYNITFPVVFDWERQSGENSRTKHVDGDTITACAASFCRTIETEGYLPMVYFSPNKGYNELSLEELLDWPFWLAHYTDDWAATSFRYHFAMWQYTSKGEVDGINGVVDLDLCLTDFSDWGQTPDGGQTPGGGEEEE